jgi:hypothetical protein
MGMLQEHFEAKGIDASDEDALLFTSPAGLSDGVCNRA